jgi:hypothetical protein
MSQSSEHRGHQGRGEYERRGCRPGECGMTAEAPADRLMTAVSAKSTTRASIGDERIPRPRTRPRRCGRAACFRITGHQLLGADDGQGAMCTAQVPRSHQQAPGHR